MSGRLVRRLHALHLHVKLDAEELVDYRTVTAQHTHFCYVDQAVPELRYTQVAQHQLNSFKENMEKNAIFLKPLDSIDQYCFFNIGKAFCSMYVCIKKLLSTKAVGSAYP